MALSARKEWVLALLLFAAVAVVPLWRSVALGEVFVPGGMVRAFEPWRQEPGEAWDILRWDSIAQFYAWREYLFSSLTEGAVPLWNRHELLGTPFLANSQSGVFYPVHWALAPLGAGRGITVSVFLHLVLAGLGCYALARRLSCGWGPAALAGITFELSQWFIAWLQLSSVPTTAAWIPWVLTAVHRLWESADAGAVSRMGGSVAMLLLAGHLQIAAYGLAAAITFALFLLAARPKQSSRSRMAFLCVAGLGLGAALAAVHLLPVLEMGRLSHRATSPTGEGYAAYVRLAMPAALLGMVVDPYFAGDPRLGTAPPNPELHGEYWGPEPLPEYAAYIGLAALVLVSYAVIRVRALDVPVWALLTVLVGTWLLALGTDLNRLPYFGVPGWAATGSPARVLCLNAAVGAVLAGIGLQQMLDDGARLPVRNRRSLGLGFFLAVAVFAACIAMWSSAAKPAAIGGLTVGRGMWLVVMPLLGAVLPAMALVRGCRGTAGPTVVLALASQLVLLAPFAATYNPTASGTAVLSFVEGVERLREASPHRIAVVNGDRWNRYAYPPAVLPPNAAIALGFDEVGGYDSLILRSTKEKLLDRLNQEDSAVLANGNMLFVKPGVLERIDELAGLSVRYVIVCSLDAKPGPAGEAVAGPLLFEIAPAPLGEVGGQPAELHWTGPNGFALEATAAGGPTLVRVAAAPGWVVCCRESERRAGWTAPSWLAVTLPPTWRRCEWRYEPDTYRVGLFLSLVGLASLVALATRTRQRSRGNDHLLGPKLDRNSLPGSSAAPPEVPSL